MAGVDLAGTNTEDVLWADGEGVRGACAPGEERASSIAREAMGGDGEEYDGMLKNVTGLLKETRERVNFTEAITPSLAGKARVSSLRRSLSPQAPAADAVR